MITLCLTPMFYVMAAEKKKVMLIIRNTFIINMINLVIIIKIIFKVDVLAGLLHLLLHLQLHQCCGARADNQSSNRNPSLREQLLMTTIVSCM